MRPKPRMRRERRVVGVHGQLDAGLLRHRHDGLEEVLEVLPQLLLGHDAVLGQRGVLHQLVVEAGGQRAAARRHGGRGAHPVEDRHPLVAPARDAQRAHVADQLDGGLDLLVAAGQAQLGLVQRRAALDHVELEAAVLVGGLDPHQRHVAPGQVFLGHVQPAAESPCRRRRGRRRTA